MSTSKADWEDQPYGPVMRTPEGSGEIRWFPVSGKAYEVRTDGNFVRRPDKDRRGKKS